MKWFRLYDEVIDDPKVMQMPIHRRWQWVEFMCIASRQKKRGSLPPVSSISFHLRCSEAEALDGITYLETMGFIDRENEVLWMHGWEARQFKSDDVTARTRAWKKDNLKPKRNVPGNVPGNGPETETETEERSSRPRAHAHARGPEDQKHFDAAVALLAGSLQTEHLAADLSRGSDLPGVLEFEGWRWLVAARVVGSPKAKTRTWTFFEGCARNATAAEFDSAGNGKPARRTPEPEPNFVKAPPGWNSKGARPK